MTDLHLHRRLNDLAHDLSPADDPIELVAGAHALHRRRRRARVGLAGAAVAVALVAVGVPAAVGTLSAPEPGDAARPGISDLPSRSAEGTAGSLEGAAEQLAAAADAVHASLGDLLAEGSVPDPEQGRPCPDAADRLSRATGMYTVEPGGINAGGGTLTGCQWSTDTTMSETPEQRLDLTLWAAHDRTTDDVLRQLDARAEEDGCVWTRLEGRTADSLMLCEGPQTYWALTVGDEDGDGAWVVTAAVGSRMPEAFGTGVGTLAELTRLVVR